MLWRNLVIGLIKYDAFEAFSVDDRSVAATALWYCINLNLLSDFIAVSFELWAVKNWLGFMDLLVFLRFHISCIWVQNLNLWTLIFPWWTRFWIMWLNNLLNNGYLALRHLIWTFDTLSNLIIGNDCLLIWITLSNVIIGADVRFLFDCSFVCHVRGVELDLYSFNLFLCVGGNFTRALLEDLIMDWHLLSVPLGKGPSG